MELNITEQKTTIIMLHGKMDILFLLAKKLLARFKMEAKSGKKERNYHKRRDALRRCVLGGRETGAGVCAEYRFVLYIWIQRRSADVHFNTIEHLNVRCCDRYTLALFAQPAPCRVSAQTKIAVGQFLGLLLHIPRPWPGFFVYWYYSQRYIDDCHKRARENHGVFLRLQPAGIIGLGCAVAESIYDLYCSAVCRGVYVPQIAA